MSKNKKEPGPQPRFFLRRPDLIEAVDFGADDYQLFEELMLEHSKIEHRELKGNISAHNPNEGGSPRTNPEYK